MHLFNCYFVQKDSIFFNLLNVLKSSYNSWEIPDKKKTKFGVYATTVLSHPSLNIQFFSIYLIKLLFASLIIGSLSTMSVWLLRASSGNNSSSSMISSVRAEHQHEILLNHQSVLHQHEVICKGRKCCTAGLILLHNILQGIISEELGECSILLEEILIGAHLWHPAIHHHHYIIHLRQEADAMCHQDACLESNTRNFCHAINQYDNYHLHEQDQLNCRKWKY